MQLRLPLKDLGLAIERAEERIMIAHAFGGAEEEPTVRLQREVEKRDELLLQLRAQVDQQIAATEQIELGKGRILDDVLLGEDQQVAEAFMDAIAAAIGFGGEEARQAFGRKIGGDAGRITAGAGRGDGPAVDIRGEEALLASMRSSSRMASE